MYKMLMIIKEITIEIVNNIRYIVVNNLRHIASFLNIVLPYLMYFIGQSVFETRGKFAVGSELFIPVFYTIIIFYIRSAANKLGKGTSIPIPDERFTQVDEDGEVSIPYNRTHELILYMADLEDHLERKGLL